MPEDKIKNLYNALSENYEMESEVDFRKNIQDPTKRRNAYQALVDDGYDMEAYEDFERNLGFGEPAANQAAKPLGTQQGGGKPGQGGGEPAARNGAAVNTGGGMFNMTRQEVEMPGFDFKQAEKDALNVGMKGNPQQWAAEERRKQAEWEKAQHEAAVKGAAMKRAADMERMEKMLAHDKGENGTLSEEEKRTYNQAILQNARETLDTPDVYVVNPKNPDSYQIRLNTEKTGNRYLSEVWDGIEKELAQLEDEQAKNRSVIADDAGYIANLGKINELTAPERIRKLVLAKLEEKAPEIKANLKRRAMYTYQLESDDVIDADDFAEYAYQRLVADTIARAERMIIDKNKKAQKELGVLTGVTDGIAGTLIKGATMSPEQYALEQQAAAEVSAESGMFDRVARGTMSFAADTPFFGLTGNLSAAVLRKRAMSELAAATARLGSRKAAENYIASQLGKSFGKRVSKAVMNNILGGAINLGAYEGASEVAHQWASGEVNPAEVFKRAAHGAAMGAALGVTGGTWGEATAKLGGAKKILSNIAGFGIEAGTFTATGELEKWANGEADQINWGEDFLESAAMLAGMKFPGGFVKMFDPSARPERFNKAEHREFMDSATGRELVDAVKGKSLKSVEEAYREFMADDDVSFVTKQKTAYILTKSMVRTTPRVTDYEIEKRGGKTYVDTKSADGGVVERIEFENAKKAAEFCGKLDEAIGQGETIRRSYAVQQAADDVAAQLGIKKERMEEILSDEAAEHGTLTEEEISLLSEEDIEKAMKGKSTGDKLKDEIAREYIDQMQKGQVREAIKRRFYEITETSAPDGYEPGGRNAAPYDGAKYLENPATEPLGTEDNAGMESPRTGRFKVGEREVAWSEGVDELSEGEKGNLHEDGMFHPVRIDMHDGGEAKPVYLIKGEVVLDDGGVLVTDKEQPIFFVGEDGMVHEGKVRDVVGVDAPMSVGEYLGAKNSPIETAGAEAVRPAPEAPATVAGSGMVRPRTGGLEVGEFYEGKIDGEDVRIFIGKRNEDGTYEIDYDDPYTGDTIEGRNVSEEDLRDMIVDERFADAGETTEGDQVAENEGNIATENIPENGNNGSGNIPGVIALGDGKTEAERTFDNVLSRRHGNKEQAKGDVENTLKVLAEKKKGLERKKKELTEKVNAPVDLTDEKAFDKIDKWNEQLAEVEQQLAGMEENIGKWTDVRNTYYLAEQKAFAEELARREAAEKAERERALAERKAAEEAAAQRRREEMERRRAVQEAREQSWLLPEGEGKPRDKQKEANLILGTVDDAVKYLNTRFNTKGVMEYINDRLNEPWVQSEPERLKFWEDVRNEQERITAPRDEEPAHPYDGNDTKNENGKPHATGATEQEISDLIANGESSPVALAAHALMGGDLNRASFESETGFGASDFSGFVGMFKKDGGKTVMQLAHGLWEEYPNVFDSDQTAREAIIEAVSSARTKAELRRIIGDEAVAMRENGAAEDMWAENARREYVAEQLGYATYDDFVASEENAIPEIIRRMNGVDEAELVEALMEDLAHEKGEHGMLINNDKLIDNGTDYDTTGETGDSVLPTPQTADTAGRGGSEENRQGEGTGRESDIADGGLHEETPAVGLGDETAEHGTLEDEAAEEHRVLADAIAEAEAQVNTEPTEGQKKAGNYKMGHVKVDDFDVTIENPKGSVRSGVDANGKEWSQVMNNTYGYIRGTEGVDGDHIDVFLSSFPELGDIFVVDQYNTDGTFDEHKVMYGYSDAESAMKDYLANYEKGWKKGRRLDITGVTYDDFKKWIDSSHRKTKPFAEYKGVKAIDPATKAQGTEESWAVKTLHELKAKHPDALFLFREGDNYAAYEEDSGKLGKVLGAGAVKGDGNTGRVYFPANALDTYLPKLIRAKQRVAICDQLEAPKAKKDTVGVVEDIKPGIQYRFVDENGRFEPTAEQRLAGEAIVEQLRGAGIEVSMDAGEMRKVLDESAGRVQEMAVEEANRRFNEQLEGLTEENADKVVLSLGRPSAVLMSAGVEDKPMKLYGSKVIKKMKKHGFNLKELRNLPGAVADPIAVFDNLGRSGNRSILTELRTEQGNFLVTIDLGKSRDVDFNIVSSVFGKNDNKIVDWIGKGYLAYVNKEKALPFLFDQSAPVAAAAAKAEPNVKSSEWADVERGGMGSAQAQELISAAKVVRNFENPKISDEILQKLTVWHGSPYSFEAFDHGNMGKGEGNQAHGWGTYVAKKKDTGVSYARVLKKVQSKPSYKGKLNEDLSIEDPMEFAASAVLDELERGNYLDDAFSLARKSLLENIAWYRRKGEKLKATIDFINEAYNKSFDLKKEDFSFDTGRNLYEVEIPEDNGRNYLDEDAELSDLQRETLEDAFKLEFNDDERSGFLSREAENALNGTGGDVYRYVEEQFNSDKEASAFLSRCGFVGIKYNGRQDGECYVIFDERDARIVNHVQFLRTGLGHGKAEHGTLGEVYGFVKGGKVYLDPARLNPNTPIHEYSHLWDNGVRAANPELWKKGVELMKEFDGGKLWDEVVNDLNYADIAHDENLIASEVKARLTGEKGEEYFEKAAREAMREIDMGEKARKFAVLNRVKEWLKDIWDATKEWLLKKSAFGDKWSREEIESLSAEDFVKMTLRDLMEGRNPAIESRGTERLAHGKGENGMLELENVPAQYFIGKKARKMYDELLNKKQPDMPAEWKKEALDYLHSLEDTKENNKKVKVAIHWLANGAIRLPEDMPKVDDALSVAHKAKIDPMQYKSPMELLDAHKEFKPSREPIDPDTVPTLRNKKDMGNGVVVYDVDESLESREAMRYIINTHFGDDCSPWCLLQGDGKGHLTDESARYWKHYNAYPKQVAFKNGKLLAFSANDEDKRVWWDRRDESHDGIPMEVVTEDGWHETHVMDADGNVTSEADEYWDGAEALEKDGVTRWRGDKKNGLYEEEGYEYMNGHYFKTAHYKDGKLEGEVLTEYSENGEVEVEPYKDGKEHGVGTRRNGEGLLTESTLYDNGEILESWVGNEWEFYYKQYDADGETRIVDEWRNQSGEWKPIMRKVYDGHGNRIRVVPGLELWDNIADGGRGTKLAKPWSGYLTVEEEEAAARGQMPEKPVAEVGESPIDYARRLAEWRDSNENLARGMDALHKIIAGEEQVKGAMRRAELEQYGGTADITFDWGKPGDAARNFKGGYVISHIFAKHGADTLLNVIDAIATGDVVRNVEGNKTVIVGKNGYEAVLSLTRNGEKESWVLTGWNTDREKEKAGVDGEVSTQSATTQDNPTFSREALGAALSRTPEEKALLDGHHSHQYPTIQELNSGAKLGNISGSANISGENVEKTEPLFTMRKLKEGEKCFVERKFRETKQFSFTAGEKLESVDDVAYIFKELEEAAVENAFAVLVKDGKPTIVHLGMGTFTSTQVNTHALKVAYERVKPDQVYFVHNHPSGILKPSREDYNIGYNIGVSLGIEPNAFANIIIDTLSGKYSTFDPLNRNYDVHDEKTAVEGENPVKVYSFDKQVFAEDYDPEGLRFGSSRDIAAFLSSQRLGKRKKLSFLVLNNQLQMTANMFTTVTKIPQNLDKIKELADKIAHDAVTFGGTRVVVYGNGIGKGTKGFDVLQSYLNSREIGMVDAIGVEEDGSYFSCRDEGVLNEPEAEYGDGKVRDGSPRVESAGTGGSEGYRPKNYTERMAEAKEVAERAIGELGNEKLDGEKQEEARKAVSEFIRKGLDSKNMPQLKKQQLNKIMSMVQNVKNARMLRRHLASAETIIKDTEIARINEQIDRLLKLKKQGRNSRGVSIAATVDERARQIFDYIKGETNELMATALDEEIKELNKNKLATKTAIDRVLTDNGIGIPYDEEAWEKAVKDNGNLLVDNGERLVSLGEMLETYSRKRELTRERDEIRNSKRPDALTSWQSEYDALMAKFDDMDIDEAGNVLNAPTRADYDRMEALTILKEINHAKMLETTDGVDPDTGQPQMSIASLKAEQERLIQQNKELRTSFHDADERDKDYIRQQIAYNVEQMDNLSTAINAVKEQQINHYRKAQELIEDVLEGGRARLQARKQAEQERKQEIILSAYDDIRTKKEWKQTKRNGELIDTEKRSAMGDFIHTLFISPLNSFGYMTQKASTRMAGTGYLYRRFILGDDGVVAAHSNHVAAMKKATEMLNEASKRFTGMDFQKAERKLKSLNDKDCLVVTTSSMDSNGDIHQTENKLTKGTMMYLHQLWNMTDGKMKLASMGFTDETMQEIRDFLGDNLIGFADWMVQEYYPQLRERMNERHNEIYLTSMAEVPNYVPIRIDRQALKGVSNMVEGSASGSYRDSLQKRNGSLVNRTTNMLPIDLSRTALDVLAEHTNTNEEWIAYARVRQDLDYLLSSKAIRNQMNANSHGSFRDFEDAARVATLMPAEPMNPVDTLFNRVSAGVVSGAIAFRLNTALKQILSFPAFYGYSQHPAYMTRLTAYVFTPLQNYRWAKENMPSFARRVEDGLAGSTDIQRELAALEDSKFKRFLQGYSKAGMIPNKLVDALTCAAGARAVYEYEYNRALKRGVPEEEAHKWAVRQADIAYNETQQSNVGAFKSAAQATTRSWVGRMTTVFQNANLGYTRKDLLAAADLLKGVKNHERLVRQYADDFGVDYATAKSAVNNNLRKAAVMFGLMGYAIKALWDWGNDAIAQLLFGGDGDDEKYTEEEEKAILSYVGEAMKHIGFVYQGTIGGNVLHDIATNGEYNPFSILVKSEVSRVSGIYDEYGISPELAAQTFVSACDLTGFKLQTWTNMYLAVEDMVMNGVDAQLALDVALILNMPKSTREKIARTRQEHFTPIEYAQAMALARKQLQYGGVESILLGSSAMTKKKLDSILDEWSLAELGRDSKKKWTELEEVIKEYNKYDSGDMTASETEKYEREHGDFIKKAYNIKLCKQTVDWAKKAIEDARQKGLWQNGEAINRYMQMIVEAKRKALQLVNGSDIDVSDVERANMKLYNLREEQKQEKADSLATH